MKRIAMIAVVALACAAVASAQNTVGSGHDLSSTGPGATTNVTRVCVFCHTPHQASSANGQDPLWNHTLATTASYGVYNSGTFNGSGTIADLGGATAGIASTSNLCLSCHDGSVSVAAFYNPPNEPPISDNNANVVVTAGGNVTAGGLMTGNPNVGTNLTDDHPVNFTYDTALATADGELNDPATTPAVAALLSLGTVQCGSCHDPHNTTFAPFLRVSNVGSALCTTCHIK